MKTYKTKDGLELNLLDVKGKDYLGVQERVRWFRHNHPDLRIETQIVELNQDYAIVKAIIYDDTDKPMANAHKREDRSHFPDYLEKAETSAIGRALALCGYGTQFATELDEGDRLADAPTERARAHNANAFQKHLEPNSGASTYREIPKEVHRQESPKKAPTGESAARLIKENPELRPIRKELEKVMNQNGLEPKDVKAMIHKLFSPKALFDDLNPVEAEHLVEVLSHKIKKPPEEFTLA